MNSGGGGGNSTTATANNNSGSQPVTATIKARPNLTTSSYYSASSGLLGAAATRSAAATLVAELKSTPPPTLPKYTSSFNAGLARGGGDNNSKNEAAGGGSYRLTALDRMALRQKFLEQQSNGTTTTTNGDATSPTPIINSKPLTNSSIDGSTKASIETNGNKEQINTVGEVVLVKTAPPPPPPKIKQLDGYVGFANLPNQVYRKAVKKGFEFTLMMVGESGLGKSTLINSLFLTDLYSHGGSVTENANDGAYPGPTQRLKKTVCVETTRVLLKENGVNLTLTMVDTPGFGDAVDNSNCWQPIIDYIESKYEDYLNSEARVKRNLSVDQRIHCCVYFIQPSGHGLKSLDVEFMKRLCDKVNIVPVIAKADTLTTEECAAFKKQIMEEIHQHKIKIYEFPEQNTDDDDDMADAKLKQKSLRDRVPFAVVGSNTVLEVDGVKVRGRRYPWGVAQVENLEHCDFVALRNMLVRTHLQDLKDVTNGVHYENYRCRKLAGLGVDGKPQRSLSNKNPLAQMDEEKRAHDQKMKKMETEMEQVFEMKVREKRQKLKDSEAERTQRYEDNKKQLEQQLKDLEEQRKRFEEEKEQWEKENNVTVEELRRRSIEGSRELVDGKPKKKKGLF